MGAQEQFPSVCLIVVLVARVLLFVTQWAVACQASLSIGFSKEKKENSMKISQKQLFSNKINKNERKKKEYWSGLQFHSPGGLPDPGIKPASLSLHSESLPSELQGKPCRGKSIK